MKNPNNNLLLSLIAQLNAANIPLGDYLNPNHQTQTNITTNLNPSAPVDLSIKNYNWAYRSFPTEFTSKYPLLRTDVFSNANSPIVNGSIDSINGNLFLFDVPQKTVGLYSANIIRRNSLTTRLNIAWSDAIAIYVNNSLVTSNMEGLPYDSRFINVSLSSGNNRVDVYLYSSSGAQNFTINNELGNAADYWQPSNFSSPSVPINLSVQADLNSVGLKDPNINILKWDDINRTNTLGYKVFRLGPYNTGIASPAFDTAASSGYFSSGTLGVFNNGVYPPATYSVSASDLNGESLATSVLYLTPDLSAFSGVSDIGSTSSSGVAATLNTGIYSYYVFSKSRYGSYAWADPVVAFNSGNMVNLFWSGGAGADFFDIYRNSGLLSFREARLFSGYLVASTLANSTTKWIDSGVASVASVSGLQFVLDQSDQYRQQRFFKDNTYRLQWGGVSGSGTVNYRVYRTFYSGNFFENSLVGITTGLSLIDSGIYANLITPLAGKPIVYNNVGIVEGQSTYRDVGVITNGTYTYKVDAYNYGYNESPLSTGYQITAGDAFPPATPSGITITSFNGFATLGWLNGNESDLQGTHIYQSGTGDSSYSLIGTTTSNTFSKFIGYSGSPWFKLANFDTSDNESPLSAQYQGSGTFVASSIVLNTFSTLTTTDLFPLYYLQSGINKPTSLPWRSNLFTSVANTDSVGLSDTWCNWIDSADNNTVRTISLNTINGSYRSGYLQNAPSGISGIYTIRITSETAPPPSLSYTSRMMMAFYSGTRLHYRVYDAINPNIQMPILTTSATGIGIGDYFNTWNSSYASSYGNYYLVDNFRPTIITSSGNFNKNVVIFMSGNNGERGALGFLGLKYDGTQTGICKYLPLDGSFGPSLSACYDNDGYVHVFSDGGNPGMVGWLDDQSLQWYKLDVSFSGNAPIKILNSGSYSHLYNGVPYGAFLLPSNTNTQNTMLYPRVFCDKNNQINMFAGTIAQRGPINYSLLDTNGNFLVSPNVQFQMPFSVDPNSWDIVYDKLYDKAYSNYNFIGQKDIAAGLFTYPNQGFNFGSYFRTHVFERYSNASLFQIIQSIIK